MLSAIDSIHPSYTTRILSSIRILMLQDIARELRLPRDFEGLIDSFRVYKNDFQHAKAQTDLYELLCASCEV